MAATGKRLDVRRLMGISFGSGEARSGVLTRQESGDYDPGIGPVDALSREPHIRNAPRRRHGHQLRHQEDDQRQRQGVREPRGGSRGAPRRHRGCGRIRRADDHHQDQRQDRGERRRAARAASGDRPRARRHGDEEAGPGGGFAERRSEPAPAGRAAPRAHPRHQGDPRRHRACGDGLLARPLGALTLEIRSELGREFHLSPKEPGRFVGAAFLLAWLCFWAVGEGLVLWLLVAGAVALLTGTPPNPGTAPLQPGPSLAIGAFLIAWISLWTLGGIAAILELLRLTVQRDRVIAGPASLIVIRRFVFFSRRVEIPVDKLRRIYLAPPKAALTAETADGIVPLSTLGTPAERDEAMTALLAELPIRPADDDALLPGSWREIVDPEGATAIVLDPRIHRIRARIAVVVATAAFAIAATLVRGSIVDPTQLGLAVMACTAALGLGWGAVRIASVNDEWRCEHGRLVLLRRVGRRARELFEATSLE